jgi:hypothetical protein
MNLVSYSRLLSSIKEQKHLAQLASPDPKLNFLKIEGHCISEGGH